MDYSSDNMKRPTPSITAKLAKRIADYSKQKTPYEVLVKRSEDIRRETEQIQEILERESKSQGTFAKWFPRVMVFPSAFMATWGGFVTIRGIWTGVIPAIARNPGVPVPPVFRTFEPVYFWISIAVYSAMWALFIYTSIRFISMTGWFRESEA